MPVAGIHTQVGSRKCWCPSGGERCGDGLGEALLEPGHADRVCVEGMAGLAVGMVSGGDTFPPLQNSHTHTHTHTHSHRK